MSHLVQIMRPVGLGLIDINDNAFNLVSSSPLCVTRMLIDSADVLPNFGLDCRQVEVVDRIECV